MTHPLLSIVTVNYNNQLGLGQTIKSLVQFRTSTAVEFICVDGKSSDGSIEIAEEFYASDRLIVEQDAGIYDAMNKGLRLASGDFIIWMNSGDKFVDDASFLLPCIHKARDATMIAFDSYLDAGSELILRKNSASRLPMNGLWHQATVFNRQQVMLLGGYSLKYKISADRDLCLSLFLSNQKLVTYDIPLSVTEPAGASSSSKYLYLDYIFIDKKHGLRTPISFYKALFIWFHYHYITLPCWSFIKASGFDQLFTGVRPQLRCLFGDPAQKR
jgi:glycosyltransferase involved in cell wall biosynthesis